MVVSTYVSGYVTKYEHGHLQEQYEGITDDKSLCSKLFRIGRMFLKSRECGMHEAADHLSGDHLYEKSVTIQWVDVRMPHKRQRRVKTHAQLLRIGRSMTLLPITAGMKQTIRGTEYTGNSANLDWSTTRKTEKITITL